MTPGYYFATHTSGWRSVVQVCESAVTGRVYVLAIGRVAAFAVSEFTAWKRVRAN